jgi:hypothetical protein
MIRIRCRIDAEVMGLIFASGPILETLKFFPAMVIVPEWLRGPK